MKETVAKFLFGLIPAFIAGALLGYAMSNSDVAAENKAAGVTETEARWRENAIAAGKGVIVENPHTGEHVFFWKGEEPSQADIETSKWPPKVTASETSR